WHLDLSKSSVDGKIAKPEPTASTEALALEVQKVGDLTVAPLNLDGKKYLRCFCWSADGKFLYALREDGLLRKIDAGTLKETIRLDLGQKCSWLALSSEGLVLTVPDAGEAWLVNPTTLKVEKQIAVESPVRVVAGVKGSLAVSCSAKEAQIIDL